jgi:hypothetical protein
LKNSNNGKRGFGPAFPLVRNLTDTKNTKSMCNKSPLEYES